jgi:hypothetical protein
MKVYLSCASYVSGYTRYHLHTKSPDWVPRDGEKGGGRWVSPEEFVFCAHDLWRLFGDQTPAVGELLELDVRPGKTWVWE